MKRLSPIDRRLAASWHQRHIEIVAKADAIAAAVGKRIDAAGRKIIGYATTGEANAATYHAIKREWARVIQDLLLYLDPVMRSMIRYSDRDAKDRLAVLVPRGWWRMLFPRMRESITEAGPARGNAFDKLFGPGAFTAGAEPALRGQGTLSDEEYAKLVRQTILPPLMESDVEAIVKSPNPHTGDSWQKRLTDLSNKVKSPDALAGEIVTGMANGENVQQIRDRVDQQVGKLNGSSQRIARTEARRVAEMANRKSWESLGELLDGAQIIAVLDERTRPKHAARNGTIYRIGGVPRFEDLPILPDEPNCRCTAAPVLKTPSEVANDPKVAAAFSNEKGQHIPDPAAYDQWFKQADEPRRRQAVGSGRYDVVKRRTATTGDKPEWKDFIKPDGSLVPVQTLKRETAAVASERKIEVAVMLAQRENLFRQIAMRPFTIGPTSAEMLTTGIIKRQALSAGAKIAAINPKAAEALIDLAKAEAAAIAAQFPNVDKEELLADVFLAYTIAKNQRSALTQ